MSPAVSSTPATRAIALLLFLQKKERIFRDRLNDRGTWGYDELAECGIEYRIDPERSHEFAEAMHALSRVRRRDGAIRWSLWKDTALPNRYLETYVVESWAEHLRQHERMTVADLGEEARVRAFHIGDKPPLVSHLIYAHDTHSVR